MMLQILNKLIYNCNVDECLNSLNINHYFWSNKKKATTNKQTKKGFLISPERIACLMYLYGLYYE